MQPSLSQRYTEISETRSGQKRDRLRRLTWTTDTYLLRTVLESPVIVETTHSELASTGNCKLAEQFPATA